MGRRQYLIMGVISVLVLFLLFGNTIGRFYLDWLWYAEDARAPGVFAVRFNTGLMLFLIGFVAFTAFAVYNVGLALKSTVVLGPGSGSDAMQQFATRALQFCRKSGGKVVWIVMPIFGLLSGLALRGSWEAYQLYTHAQPFGVSDPIFGNDISFYVFQLPFLKFLAGHLIGLILIPGIACALVYAGGQGIAGAGKLKLAVPRALPHLSVLLGLLLLAGAWSIWLGRYDMLYESGSLFTGMGYTDAHSRLPVQTLLCYLCAGVGLLSIFTARRASGMRMQFFGLAILALGFIIGNVIYPGILQSTVVKPNELAKETPYIRYAIEATRKAYQLDKIRVQDYPVNAEPTEADVAASRSTLDNMRLWDYRVLPSSYDNLQRIKPYYRFNEVDVDRYMINGKQRMVNIAARELYTEGLGAGLTWQNLKFQYTHGLGVVMNPVNSADREGRPNFVIGDLPPRTPADLPLKEPRIYFGEGGLDNVFVRSKLAEFDIAEAIGRPETQEPAFSYLGKAGIGIDTFWRRNLLGMVTGDISVLTTEAFTPKTKYLIRRDIRTRAAAILPFLQFDDDPYVVVADGRVYWLMDGYTTTSSYPYSAHMGASSESSNYIRNSVKVTIDAATGDFRAYLFEPSDPIARTYQRIYPGLLKSKSEMPKGLLAHIRYPEEMFMEQCRQLQLYHMTNPKSWYQKEDRWSLPQEAGSGAEGRAMEAYYVQMRIPDEEGDGFLLMLPFTPVGRPNMSAWLAAHCDPDRYGELVLYRFPQNSNLIGPRQAGNLFFQNERISQWVTLVGQQGSEVIRGNLLVVPLGQSIMYVEPMYLQATAENRIPELKKVALATQTRIAFGDTYEQALKELLGAEPAPTETRASPSEQAVQTTAQVVADLLKAREAAKGALAKGDWAAFGEAERRVDDGLRRLQNAAKGSPK